MLDGKGDRLGAAGDTQFRENAADVELDGGLSHHQMLRDLGVAFCALGLRTRTIWPLILLHALWDFMLNAAHLPMALYPVEYLLLLGYGIFLLRRGVTLAGNIPAKREQTPAQPVAEVAAR